MPCTLEKRLNSLEIQSSNSADFLNKRAVFLNFLLELHCIMRLNLNEGAIL